MNATKELPTWPDRSGCGAAPADAHVSPSRAAGGAELTQPSLDALAQANRVRHANPR